jgi:hypothetical protein
MKSLFLLCAFGALTFAQEGPAPAAVEGVRGVRQEGSGKVKEVDPSAKNVAPTTVQGVDKVDGVRAPGGAKAVKQTPPPAAVTEAAKPVEVAGTKTPPPPPVVKGVEAVKGVKPPEAVKPAAGGIRPVEGVTGIGAGKQRNLEAALQVKPAGKPEPAKAKAAAALLGGAEPRGKPERQDDRKLFEEIKKIPDNGS